MGIVIIKLHSTRRARPGNPESSSRSEIIQTSMKKSERHFISVGSQAVANGFEGNCETPMRQNNCPYDAAMAEEIQSVIKLWKRSFAS